MSTGSDGGRGESIRRASQTKRNDGFVRRWRIGGRRHVLRFEFRSPERVGFVSGFDRSRPQTRDWLCSGKSWRDPWSHSTRPRFSGRSDSVRSGPRVAAFCPYRLPLGSFWRIVLSFAVIAERARMRMRCLRIVNCQRALWGIPRASVPEWRRVWFMTHRDETTTV